MIRPQYQYRTGGFILPAGSVSGLFLNLKGGSLFKMTEWINGVKIGTTQDAKISLRIPDLSMEGCVTLREARMMEDGLAAAISACILPNQAFRWEEPTGSFKANAVLRCEDPRFLAQFNGRYLPQRVALPENDQSKIAGFVMQAPEPGFEANPGQYIAVSYPDWAPIIYNDFEDAQAAVAAKLRAEGMS